jgi:GNAT superfamily N-acetyltransferase
LGRPRNARFAAIEAEGELVATAIATLEIGVPTPVRPGAHCAPRERHHLPDHRGHVHGTILARHVMSRARSIAADRIGLSATAPGQRIYEKPGFTVT